MSAFETGTGAVGPTGATGPAGAMVLISDTTLGADTASFDVQSIPGTYKHLRLVLYGRCADGAALVGCGVRFNNDSGGNYHTQQIAGSGTTASAFETENATAGSLVDVPGGGATASYFGMSDTLIPNYAGTTGFKPCSSTGVAPNSTTVAYVEVYTFHWRDTSAINRITIFPGAGNFLAGSRLTIYGLN